MKYRISSQQFKVPGCYSFWFHHNNYNQAFWQTCESRRPVYWLQPIPSDCKKVGLVIMVGDSLQVVRVLLRPHPPQKRAMEQFRQRKPGVLLVWEFLHKGMGIGLLVPAGWLCNGGISRYYFLEELTSRLLTVTCGIGGNFVCCFARHETIWDHNSTGRSILWLVRVCRVSR